MVESSREQHLAKARLPNALWVLAIKACALVVTLLSATVSGFFGGPDALDRVKALYPALAALFLFCGASALWLKYRLPTARFLWWQMVADVALVTGIIYVTGASTSPFLFLYLPLVMMAAILVSRRAALAVTALASASYLGLMLSLHYRLLASPDGISTVYVISEGVALQIVGLISAMFLIAVATSFLAVSLRSSYHLVQESEASAKSQQLELIEKYPDGVILASLDETIINLNTAARDLLQLGDSDVSGATLEQALKNLEETMPVEKLMRATEALPLRLQFKGRNESHHKTVESHCKPLKGAHGETQGKLIFFQDITRLRSAEEQLELQERMARLLAEQSQPIESAESPLKEFIGSSPVIRKVFSIISRVAESDATILVTGESGTGKELVAKAIHASSARANNPFVAVNCGAIPENLIESELFGYKKGAFTGAESDTLGLFRQAQGGTIFLDEIGELPLLMQTKLLRALQEKKVRPVGATTDIPIDLRIVTATNRNLRREVEVGNFREDLFYRLNVIGIQLPPLRDRRDDIPLLVNATLSKLTKNRAAPMVPPATMKLLIDYNYPGNVRELENILERAMVLGGDAILPEHLPDNVRDFALHAADNITTISSTEEITFPVSLEEVLAAIEKKYLLAALLHAEGGKKKAAELLGINFRSFRYRLEKFELGSADDTDEQSAKSSKPAPESR